jgi:hypothetical protein
VAVVSAIRLRFVAGKDDISLAIILRSQICMPFTPSHVECVTPEGKYAGQHAEGGMLARDPGYDKSYLAHELFVDLPANDTQVAIFYAYVGSLIGQPYDLRSILDYLLPVDFHDVGHSICSAAMTLALRKCGFFQWPLAVPAHLVSPRDLLFTLSSHLEIDH